MDRDEIFPFQPRHRQDEFMKNVMRALDDEEIVIVTAPNGFGKTVCALVAGIRSGFKKIYYSTRTHKQAENVIKTIKIINEKNGKNIVSAIELSGRERSCINDDQALLMKNDPLLKCAKNKAGDYCKNGKEKSDWLRIRKKGAISDLKFPSVMDTSEVKVYCEKLDLCPYYFSIAAQEEVNVVACSYNHVFDKSVRDSTGIDIENSLIICDESHNIIDAMESFLTRELSTDVIEKARKSPVNITPKMNVVFSKIESMLSKSESFFKANKGRRTIKVDDIAMFLEKQGITPKWIGWATGTLKKADEDNGFFSDIMSFLSILRNDSEKSMYFQSVNKGGNKKRVLKIVSMDVKPILKEIKEKGAKILFMSGTLSPNFFKKRLGIVNVKVQEYNLPKRRLQVHVADMIPGYHKMLSSYYKERNDENVLKGFGKYISTILPAIPAGSIAFFPSYDFRDQVIGAWEGEFLDYNDDGQECFVIDGGELVPIFLEKRDDKTKSSIANFKRATKKGRALLLSIFRGGASEGEDFPGDYCRGVFCVGFPMMNTESGEVKFKMNYYNEKMNGSGLFWVLWNTMLSVSQAVGRGIRDPANDKAVAILLGTRYQKRSNLSLLCGWIKDCIELKGKWNTPKEIATAVKKFFAK